MFCHRPANLPFEVLAAFSHSALDDGLTLVGHLAGAGLRPARRSSSCPSSQIGDITLSALRPCTGQAGTDGNCLTAATGICTFIDTLGSQERLLAKMLPMESRHANPNDAVRQEEH